MKIVTMFAVLLLTGCAATSTNYIDPRLIIGPKAKSYLTVPSVIEGSASSLLRSGVSMVAKSSETIRFLFAWLDESGFDLKGLSSRWELLPVRRGELVSIDRVSPSPKAKDFRIYLFDINSSVTSASKRK